MKGRWTSRKFWAAMFWQGVMTLLVYMDKIDQNVFESITFCIVGGYLASNAAEKFAKKKKTD